MGVGSLKISAPAYPLVADLRGLVTGRTLGCTFAREGTVSVGGDTAWLASEPVMATFDAPGYKGEELLCNFDPGTAEVFDDGDAAYYPSRDGKFRVRIVRHRNADPPVTMLFCEFALPLGEGHYKFESLSDETYATFQLQFPPFKGDWMGHGWKKGRVMEYGGYILNLSAERNFTKCLGEPVFMRITARNIYWDDCEFAGDLAKCYERPVWW